MAPALALCSGEGTRGCLDSSPGVGVPGVGWSVVGEAPLRRQWAPVGVDGSVHDLHIRGSLGRPKGVWSRILGIGEPLVSAQIQA